MKNSTRMHFCPLRTLLAIALLASPLLAMADYPDKPITLIVPWAAGGGSDSVARALSNVLQEELGTTINVVNRAGGNGIVGHAAISGAKPDGYTIGLATTAVSMLHWMGHTKLSRTDFTPIAMVNYDYSGLQISTDSPYDDAGALLEAIKTEPQGTFKGAGTGVGGIWHVAFAGLLVDQGIDTSRVTWIPSQGAAPALAELAAGGVDIVPSSVPEGRAMMEAGKAKSIAVMAPERNPSFPDVPTLKEAIGSDYTLGEWRAIVGPAGMDPAIAKKLEKAVEVAYNSDSYQDFMKRLGFGMKWLNTEEFNAFLVENDTHMSGIIDSLGLKK
ncbi:tripartite tricarboxylate transporter substrate binding protein [Pseudomonas sp.]|uniref:Bug family tripartite tricarboxylate transporter substrate binding protein n=1 Tax=Pseudomonas sp. TaxID=306 RepID=UPI00299F1845|nr:tripartite tricarboxylate transporter substrate binding protein [Pseudomonas sp.]MDX1366688.1 tripartite tricarboxylate transporter substrate binding protein [Pseudomonas sp.]